MTSPQFLTHNSMCTILYVMVGNNMLYDSPWYTSLEMMPVLFAGLAVAPIVNLLPFPRLAMKSTEKMTFNLQNDLTIFLTLCKSHESDATAKPAKASLKLLYPKILQTIQGLKRNLTPTALELKLCCCFGKKEQRTTKQLGQWISRIEKILPHLQCIQSAMTKVIVLPSSTTAKNDDSTEHDVDEVIQHVDNQNARNRAIDAMIASFEVLADESAAPPDVVLKELEQSLLECHTRYRKKLVSAYGDENWLRDNLHPDIFSHMTSQMAVFHAILQLGDSLVEFLKQLSSSSYKGECAAEESPEKKKGSCFSSIGKWLTQRWLFHDQEEFRLAFKTALGMMIASLFVSIPYLQELSNPHSLWPGYTIGSVNLATTGSSFHKAGDRFIGTLFAAAWGLFVVDFWPGHRKVEADCAPPDDCLTQKDAETNDGVKIPAVVVFTFVAYYLLNQDHDYRYKYAAYSIGSVLYGSVSDEYHVFDYIPKRVELIFCGLVIFVLIECLLWVRSSRKLVEKKALSIFLCLQEFIRQLLVTSKRMEDYALGSRPVASSKSTDVSSLSEIQSDDFFQLKDLDHALAKLKAETLVFKTELQPALEEPLLGFSLPLHSSAFHGLAEDHDECVTCATLLVKNMKELISRIQISQHPENAKPWGDLQIALLSEELQKAESSNQKLQSAFPDGRLRPQEKNLVGAIAAAASFRGFRGDFLTTSTKLADICSGLIRNVGVGDGSADTDSTIRTETIMTTSITTAYVLKLCWQIERAGIHLENIVYNFPQPRPQITKKDQ